MFNSFKMQWISFLFCFGISLAPSTTVEEVIIISLDSIRVGRGLDLQTFTKDRVFYSIFFSTHFF